MNTFITLVILALIVIAIAVVLVAYFYHRSTREVSLIRTGVGGRRVVMDGGVIAIPYFQDIGRVNMQTLRLDVQRNANQALITRDRMRVDISAEFYVSVEPEEEAIARASQTLGSRIFDADRLKGLIEGKLVDTLRSEAAKRTMDELHENRSEFAAAVREALTDTLSRNGLSLDSVSLSALDQTPFASLDENNAFNAVGMRRLAEVIATSKKERADIDTDADVAVHRAAMEASKRKLQIDLERKAAEIEQSRELEGLRASQIAEIAARKAESERTASEARIRMEQEIRKADIAREQAIKEAEQDRAIANAKKTQDESKAIAAADLARAEAVEAAEAIATARALAEAQRASDVAMVAARRDQQVSREELVSRAKAEAEASIEQAKAAKLRIATMKEEMAARAEGNRALNEAENLLTAEIAELRMNIARLEALPGIVEQLVKPAEKIESINVHHVTGGFGYGRIRDDKERSPVNATIDSILDMAAQLPSLRKISRIVDEDIEDPASASEPKPDEKQE